MPKTAVAADDHEDDLRSVMLPSGAIFWVFQREVGYFEDRVKRYLKDNKFTNVSDLQDVDRLAVLELLSWRYGIWVSQQKDYWGEQVDENTLSKHLKELSTEVRQLKASLGIDKLTREKQKGEDSLEKYLSALRDRARQFGVMREEQFAKGMELFNEAKALVVLYFNCDDDERREMHVTAKDVLEWFRDVAIPEYDAIDQHFRENVQRYWIKDQ